MTALLRRYAGSALWPILGVSIFLLAQHVWRNSGRPAQALGPPLDALQSAFAAALCPGLERSQNAMTMDEYDYISSLSRRPGVLNLVYLNKYGEVRWFQDPSQITCTFEQFSKAAPLPTDAVEQASLSKTPVVRAVPGPPLYEVAVPLVRRGETAGMVSFQATDETLRSLTTFTGDYRALVAFPSRRTKPAHGKAHTRSARQSMQYYLSGLIFFQQGDLDKARREWEHSSALDPGNELAREAMQRLERKS